MYKFEQSGRSYCCVGRPRPSTSLSTVIGTVFVHQVLCTHFVLDEIKCLTIKLEEHQLNPMFRQHRPQRDVKRLNGLAHPGVFHTEAAVLKTKTSPPPKYNQLGFPIKASVQGRPSYPPLCRSTFSS